MLVLILLVSVTNEWTGLYIFKGTQKNVHNGLEIYAYVKVKFNRNLTNLDEKELR